MEMHPRMPTEPVLDLRRFMRRIVVQDHVDAEALRDAALNARHEAEKFIPPMARQTGMVDVSRRDIERRKQGGGAVALVVMREGAGPACAPVTSASGWSALPGT